MSRTGEISSFGKPIEEVPVIEPGHTFRSVTDKLSSIVLFRPIGKGWVALLCLSGLFLMIFTSAVCYLLLRGVGIWGIDIPVAWGFAIVNFVWWIGIGHAGTFISAFLLLLRQDWRTSINRFAEAMTIFAVAQAAMFPLLHLGRIWYFYWLFPYPNTMLLWPQFRSPLVWDVFAVSTYTLVSILFWYMGLIPDFATLRDKARRMFPKVVYGILSMGWRNSARHWHRYSIAYLLLAGLAAPLVVSVHSVVGMDFAAAQLPGWHSTIFPPYFVAGAIFSGFAMVLTLAIPLRYAYGLQDLITIKHLNNCAKLMLVTGMIVSYGYGSEIFLSWLSGDKYDWFMTQNRMFGPYWASFWCIITCNVLCTQLLWWRQVRTHPVILFVVSMFIQLGMWMERYVIVITSLHRDFLPSSWGMYYPTIWDWATLLGTCGFFLFLFLLFIRLLPAISIFEIRELVEVTEKSHAGGIPSENRAAVTTD